MTSSESSPPTLITLADYFQGRNIEYADEFTPEIEANAKKLLLSVNGLLSRLGVSRVRVSSGWRPPSVNSRTPGSAKRSYHQQGRAVDIRDGYDGFLAHKILQAPSALKEYGLWLEEPSRTPGWVHLDNGDRPDRTVRVFLP